MTAVSPEKQRATDIGKPARRRRFAVWCVVGFSLVLGGWFFRLPAMVLVYQANRHLVRGCPDQAMVCLNRARSLNGANAELEFLTARAYRIQGEMNLAASHLKRAWKLGFPVPKLEREQTLAMAQSGQLEKADPQLSNLLIDSRGDMTNICEAFVIGYLRTYRLSQAERLLTAWLADSPGQPRALLLRAKLQIELLNWKPAEQDLRAVVAAVPEHAEAADLLAGILLKQKLPEAALQVLPVAIKNPRTRLSARLREIECQRILGRDQVAKSLVQSVLQEFPNSMQAHLDLGSLESDAGEFDMAVGELERARELAPQSPDVRYALAVALRGAGRETEAKDHFEYVYRAREAVAEVMNLRSAVSQKPADAELRCRIGTTLLEYGQTERGLIWLQSALDIDPQLISVHQKLAEYYEGRASESSEFEKLATMHRNAASSP